MVGGGPAGAAQRLTDIGRCGGGGATRGGNALGRHRPLQWWQVVGVVEWWLVVVGSGVCSGVVVGEAVGVVVRVWFFGGFGK